jgi:glutaredoxin|tara:strand:- start:562 stop:786 length:225 start_codon:yes stop_codon:yes gene_type:complete
MIEIYGKTQCPYCDKAKALCERKGYDYVYKSLGEDFTREEMMEAFPTARTFPQIRIDGEAIGGYDNFADWSSVE